MIRVYIKKSNKKSCKRLSDVLDYAIYLFYYFLFFHLRGVSCYAFPEEFTNYLFFIASLKSVIRLSVFRFSMKGLNFAKNQIKTMSNFDKFWLSIEFKLEYFRIDYIKYILEFKWIWNLSATWDRAN